jgi:hypothetical protein
MNNINKKAKDWIEEQDTKFCRTTREKAKYLQGKLTAYEIPHPAIWNEVGMIAAGLRK